MTKLKNTKKGMAKKALSISLVAAMLATSNVPVWAAEDLFSDSTAVEAEVDTFSAETPVEDIAPIAEEADNAAVLQAESSSNAYEATVAFAGTGLKDNKITWGNEITATVSVKDAGTQTAVPEGKLYYAWKVDGLGTTEAKLEGNSVTISPDGTYAGKSLTLFLMVKNEDGDVVWTYTSDAISVEAKDISSLVSFKDNAITAPEYNGKAHNVAITEAMLNIDTSIATGFDIDDYFDVSYSGDNVNVTDDGIAVTLTAKKAGYKGKVTTSYKIGPMVLDGTEKRKIEDHFVATLTTASYAYTGTPINVKKGSVKLTDKDTGVELTGYLAADANDYVGASTKKNAGESENIEVALLETPAKGSVNKNYKITASAKKATTTNKLTIAKRDLSSVTATITAKQYDEGKTITVNAADITYKDKNTNETLTLNGDVKWTVPESAKNPGEYTVTFAPDVNNTNVTGSTSATLTVFSSDISQAKFGDETYAQADEQYTGEQVVKDIAKLGGVKIGNKTIAPTDYEITFGENINANDTTDVTKKTGVVIIKGKNSYAGSQKEYRFAIKPATITANTLTVNNYVERIDTQNASDYETSMGLVVKAKNTAGKEFTLQKDVDYTVEYEIIKDADGKDAKVRATVNSKNKNFTGVNVVKESNITGTIIKDGDIKLKQTSFTYTGKAIIPEFDVIINGRLIAPDQYTVKTITGNLDAGTATLVITGEAGSDYSDSVDAKATFTITPANAADLVGVIPSQQYTGYSLQPALQSLTLNGVDIDVSKNFDLAYGTNVNIGEGTVTLTPKANNKNFTGTKSITFKISGKLLNAGGALAVYDKNNLLVTGDKLNFSYDGTAHTYNKVLFNYSGSEKLKEDTDYEIKYVDNVYGKKTDAGQMGAVLVVAKGTNASTYGLEGVVKDGIYTDAAGNKVENVMFAQQFKIAQQSVYSSNISVGNGTYAGGLEVKPEVIVSVNGKTLIEGTDYDLKIDKAHTQATATKELSVEIVPKNGYTVASGQKMTFNWGIDKFDLANADISAKDGKVVVKCGKVDVDTSEYTVTTNADGTITITAAKTSKNYTGTKTVKGNGETDAERPVAPVISAVNVKGNKATVVLAGESDGATGYDYVISKSKVFTDKASRVDVKANVLTTETTFQYINQGVYYAYLHSWKRVDGKKVFSGWSNAYPFMISSITPEQPTVTSVKVTGKTVKVTYTKSANATGYDLVLGSAVKKVNGEKRPVEYGKLVKKVYKGNTVTATFTNVPKGTYYAGLHAYNRTSENNGKVFSPWSNTKKVTVK
ncbi:hypothetical protein NXH76_14970 [Blautia schinkii]|nr:hypothetical protein [Blautia schinkii]